MDVSVIAAVGSFAVSERILKPKASLLALLGLLLAYDLTTKTHDVTSLRVYRGPALLAFCFLMAAFSLRTWRRNGVACDELLFLPGTQHGHRHGIEGPLVEAAVPDATDHSHRSNGNEGDVAAGWKQAANTVAAEDESGQVTAVPAAPSSSEPHQRPRASSVLSQAMSPDDSGANFANSWDESEEHEDDDDGGDEQLMVPLTVSSDASEQQASPRTLRRTASRGGDPSSPSNLELDGTTDGRQGPVDRFRENHPRITRLGSIFFFRSSQETSTHSATYAPSGPHVVGAAMDMTMPVLFNFHMFIEAYNSGNESLAKILPLIFLSVLIVRAFVPPGKRGRFWSTVWFTFAAPFQKIRFRDAYIGDVLTSLVRPVQDMLFALSYYVTVIYGTASGRYGLKACGEILESSWILHNVILPSCALLPLWWKFLQTLREAYDTGKRWPALGNAVKYMTASLVILYGMTHHEDRRSPWWIVCFGLCVLYQIWWDTVMDWELFCITREPADADNGPCFGQPRISSVRPDSHVLLALQRNILQPIWDCMRLIFFRIPRWKQIQLRPIRLFKDQSIYYKIFIYNAVFRFAWMLCYIPAYHLSTTGQEHVTTFSSDTHSYVGVLLPVAEILRRTFWGFLMLERETIHMMDGDPNYRGLSSLDEDDTSEEDELDQSMMSETSKSYRQYLPTWLGAQQQLQVDAAAATSRCHRLKCDEEMREKLYIAELSTWAVVFVALGLWATN